MYGTGYITQDLHVSTVYMYRKIYGGERARAPSFYLLKFTLVYNVKNLTKLL